MRLLANENVPRSAVEAMRAAGHDVAWIRTEAPGARDEDVLERSRREARVLLTLDKDFGELVLKRGRDASQGVILLRLPGAGPAELAALAVTAVGARNDWSGFFSVVERDRTRMRPLMQLTNID